jgi:hypothetical protein
MLVLCGRDMSNDNIPTISANDISIAVHPQGATVPKNLDLRNSGLLADCATQGSCGSCYAIVATQILHDRLALSGGAQVPPLSHQLIADCSKNCVLYRGNVQGCSEDCAGGFVTAALEFLTKVGTVEESLYQPKHSNTDVHWEGPEIRTSCTMSNAASSSVRYKATGHYGVTLDRNMANSLLLNNVNPVDLSNEQREANARNIMVEIYTSGPVCATFNMFSDLLEYLNEPRSTPYRIGWKTPKLGWNVPEGNTNWTSAAPGPDGKTYFVMAHAVSLIGYGETSSGEPYWLVRNSWGPSTCSFRIARGKNHSSIESMVEAPSVAASDTTNKNINAVSAATMTKPPPSSEEIGGAVGGALVGFLFIVIVVMFFVKR